MNRKRAETILKLYTPWTRKDVRKAYKLRAKELHPDKHPNRKDMAIKFIELKEAYDYLLGWEHTSNDNRHTETTILEELLTKIADSYQEALIPFIRSLPSQKQKWIIDFLEMYGEFLIGQDVFTLLAQIREEQQESILINKNIETIYDVYFHELLTDKIIVHDVDDKKIFFPSWCTEWNAQPIKRILPKHVSMDSSNNIFFHISIAFRTLYTMNNDIVPLSMSYFSNKNIIHVKGYVPRDTIHIKKEYQKIKDAHIQTIHIYDDQGNMISEKKNDGIFLPEEPLDTPSKRSTCSWLISLTP